VLPLPETNLSGDWGHSTVVAKCQGPARLDPPLLAIGSLLDETYEIRGLLGTGGMGQVFDAQDLDLDRRVAVKVARPARADALHLEGRALASVRHPSVVGVYHSGVHDGHSYLVIEHITGPTLRSHMNERLREKSLLPLAAVVRLLRAIAEALAVVHAVGLSHRDLKPENVMLSMGDRVVLTDLGLTRSDFVADDEDLIGTPTYMAPEIVIRCVQRGAGHLVDLYALGIVAYEMIVGRAPFDRGASAKTLCAHVFEPAPDLRVFRAGVPDALAGLVLDLLAKSPEERPENAAIVAQRLASPGIMGRRRLRSMAADESAGNHTARR
jgi:serine/threonine protein kinase